MLRPSELRPSVMAEWRWLSPNRMAEWHGRMALVIQEKGLASGELGTYVGVLALGAREGERDHLGCLACKRRLEKWA